MPILHDLKSLGDAVTVEPVAVTPPTDVIFRKDTRNGEIIAILPGLAGTNDPKTCAVYVNNGGHGWGYPHVIDSHSKLAEPKEYQALMHELQEFGYRVNPVKKVGRHHDKARRAELER